MRKKITIILILVLAFVALTFVVYKTVFVSYKDKFVRIWAITCASEDTDCVYETVTGTGEITILIVYHTIQEHTANMAKAVAEGAQTVPGVKVVLKPVEKATANDALNAHAIILGSPVHNANVTPEMQRYINNWPFGDPSFAYKIGAAFATGGGISAGEELVQTNILHSMLIYNMIVVGGPNWPQPFGASAVTNEPPFLDSKSTEIGYIEPQFLHKGKFLGVRVAKLAVLLDQPKNQKSKDK